MKEYETKYISKTSLSSSSPPRRGSLEYSDEPLRLYELDEICSILSTSREQVVDRVRALVREVHSLRHFIDVNFSYHG